VPGQNSSALPLGYCSDFGGLCRSNFRKAGNGKSTPDRGGCRSGSRFFARGRPGRFSRWFRFMSRQAGLMPL
jgi:hypothetical protein